MKVSYVEDLADHHGLIRYAERGNSLGVVSDIRETQASYRAPKTRIFCAPTASSSREGNIEASLSEMPRAQRSQRT